MADEPFAESRDVVLPDGTRIGEFSSHWAACAALIRLKQPDFESLGGDGAEDLALERRIASAMETFRRLERLAEGLRCARSWHEAEKKALSKGSSVGNDSFRFVQHTGEIDAINEALMEAGYE